MINQNFFYHRIIRNTIIAFGSMFSDIKIQRTDEDGKRIQDIRVPISYSPKMTFLRKLQQDPDLNSKTAIDLPRLSFAATSYQYDAARKVNRIHRHRNEKDEPKQQFSPVPFNIVIELYFYTKTQEDGLIILEQILPNFTPEFTVTINAIPEMDVKQDVPFVLNGVTVENTQEIAGFEKLSAISYAISFIAKVNLYGPVSDQKQIKKVEVDYTKTNSRYRAEVVPGQAKKSDPHTIDETFDIIS